MLSRKVVSLCIAPSVGRGSVLGRSLSQNIDFSAFANQKEITKQKVQEAIRANQRHKSDTGSPAAQSMRLLFLSLYWPWLFFCCWFSCCRHWENSQPGKAFRRAQKGLCFKTWLPGKMSCRISRAICLISVLAGSVDKETKNVGVPEAKRRGWVQQSCKVIGVGQTYLREAASTLTLKVNW